MALFKIPPHKYWRFQPSTYCSVANPICHKPWIRSQKNPMRAENNNKHCALCLSVAEPLEWTWVTFSSFTLQPWRLETLKNRQLGFACNHMTPGAEALSKNRESWLLAGPVLNSFETGPICRCWTFENLTCSNLEKLTKSNEKQKLLLKGKIAPRKSKMVMPCCMYCLSLSRSEILLAVFATGNWKLNGHDGPDSAKRLSTYLIWSIYLNALLNCGVSQAISWPVLNHLLSLPSLLSMLRWTVKQTSERLIRKLSVSGFPYQQLTFWCPN